MELLERETQLAQLGALLAATERGRNGCCVLISGEAGVGKTSFVRCFAEQQRSRFELLWAGCEALFTPRPLGPLVDLADNFPPSLAASIHEGRTHNGLFPSLLTFLRERKTPVLLVIEDLHWADEATLDLIRYVGRRIESAPVLLVLTYRDDELGLDHPLRKVLGEFSAVCTERLALPLLSEPAVEGLAKRAGRSPQGLFRATDGNPFFVTEALESAPGEVPASIRDAVLARLGRLSAPARSVAELASIAPARVERTLIKTLLGPVAKALDECLDHGVLRAERGWIAFRHELARQSVEQSLPPGRVTTMHAEMFRALRSAHNGTAELSRLVHHAERAGLINEVLRLAPVAAADASRTSAHREATVLYTLALRHSDRLSSAPRAELLEAAALEYKLTHDVDRAIDASRAALEERRALGDTLREGANLHLLAGLCYQRCGDRDAYAAQVREAIAVLERVPVSPALAEAYASLSHALALASRYADAAIWGKRAVELAEPLNDPPALIVALCRLGYARRAARNDPDAEVLLEKALALAMEQGLEDVAGNIFTSLQTFDLIYYEHTAALARAERGLAYCEARDLDQHAWGILERRALSLFELGRWAEAEEVTYQCLDKPNLTPMARDTTRFLLHRLALRRGQPDVEAFWNIPRLLEQPVLIGYRLPFIAGACAELAWLRGDNETVKVAACAGLKSAFQGGEARLIGPLMIWLKRIDADVPAWQQPLLLPHQLELAGDWAGAAREWAKHGCVYDEAMVLTFGDEAAIRRALDIFEALGAMPAANVARQRLRTLGARGVQRGPQAHTRTDPHGLTRREREIFDLLAQGLPNQAIAQRLFRSERTVEHHVSSLLEKIGVNSRSDVMAIANRSKQEARN